MADRGEALRDPEFGIRMLGYSRTEVDEFVAEVRRELRALGARLAGESGSVRVLNPAPAAKELPPVSAHLARLLRYAEEEAVQRVTEARFAAEQTLRSARELADQTAGNARQVADQTVSAADELAERTVTEARDTADRIIAEARRRATQLEVEVAATLDREVHRRVGEMSRTHGRLVAQLAGIRDAVVALLDADSGRGPLDPEIFRDLVPRQQVAARQ